MALKNIRELFPKELRQHFEEGIISLEHLQEIRLQIGQPVRLLSDGREYFINEEGRLQHHLSGCGELKSRRWTSFFSIFADIPFMLLRKK